MNETAGGFLVRPEFLAEFVSRIATASPSALCPDLLRYEQIGEADGWRGRVVRGFFWCLRAWPNPPPRRP